MLGLDPRLRSRLADAERMVSQAKESTNPSDPIFEDLVARSVRLLQEVQEMCQHKAQTV